MSHEWQTNTLMMVLTDADLVLSPWKGQAYAYQPRSSMTGSPPYISRMGPSGKLGHSFSLLAVLLIGHVVLYSIFECDVVAGVGQTARGLLVGCHSVIP